MVRGMTANPTIYLDYNATAPIKPGVRVVMVDALTMVGNASSVHGFGRDVRRDVERARDHLADLINTQATNVTFTSGATEANNMVLFGTSATRILISAVEHPSLTELADILPAIEIIPVTKDGVVDLDWLKKNLSQDDRQTLISVMMVNNETGVIQPIKDIVALTKAHGKTQIHCDGVQALGKIDIDFDRLGIDFLSLSAHKFGGPMGVGALVFDHHTSLKKLTHGGGQERSRRAGTENVPAILGFGEAARLAKTDHPHFKALNQWREAAEEEMLSAIPQAIIFGQNAPRVANTIQVSLPGIKAETQLMALDLDGIAVSSGSACSSGSIKPSHVLLAMGASEEQAKGALRFSAGWNTSEDDVKTFVKAWIKMAKGLGF